VRSKQHTHLKHLLGIGINLIGLFFRSRFIDLDIRLQVFEYYVDENNYSRRSFRFAVVDFSKSKSYPQNFVCVLPVQLGKGKSDSAFLKVFKDKSLEQAKALLKDALEREDDSEVKAEIERRLMSLEPKRVNQIKCSGCGKLFQPKRIRKLKNNFCEECMKKKFESRVLDTKQAKNAYTQL
jgi:DNA-directed RNA polymerase subunit RPC12/RpoP